MINNSNNKQWTYGEQIELSKPHKKCIKRGVPGRGGVPWPQGNPSRPGPKRNPKHEREMVGGAPKRRKIDQK